MLRSWPHLEDHGATAGGDTSAKLRGMGKPISFMASRRRNASPDFDRTSKEGRGPMTDADIYQYAQDAAVMDDDEDDIDQNKTQIDFLKLVREAEDQAQLYVSQVNRRSWTQTLRAFHNEHFVGSKYTKTDWRNRSKIFRPKTRSAVLKDQAAVAASLFGTVDSVNCLPGNDGDPQQRAAASIMQELVNYRTDRTSGKSAIPWFQVAMGARQDCVLTGVCMSKQSWKLELKKTGTEEFMDDSEGGDAILSVREVWEPEVDRPDCQVFPPENYVIDPAADWTDPAQSAAYVIIKHPLQMEDVRRNQDRPFNPWKRVPEEAIRGAYESGKWDTQAIRRARELGVDRMDEATTGTFFQIVWVYEVFMRVDGEDWTFFSCGSQHYLTDPKPVGEVYPEQGGSRPLVMGYGSLEAHRIFPMGPAESWQQYQMELNDIINLQLDAMKQNVMPITKIVRGRQVDLDQIKRRSSGSAILVTNPDDVTFERVPDLPQSIPMLTRELELEFDDLAGQMNGQTAENNNALSRTLGGLKLVSGSANAAQEYAIRIWIQTWTEPVLSQVVNLEQWYESDPVVLGICGQRAQLFKKHGVSKIDDELLEQEVTIRVSVGLGAGDPAQRLQKFTSAVQIVAPLLQQCREFQSGQIEMDWEAVVQEVFGAAGYRDGGMRFFKQGQGQQQSPILPLQLQELESKIAKNQQTGKAAMFTGIAALAKVALGKRELEAEVVNNLLGHKLAAADMGSQHAHAIHDRLLAAKDHGHRHGIEIAQHRAGMLENALGMATNRQASDQAQQNTEIDRANTQANLKADRENAQANAKADRELAAKSQAAKAQPKAA
jgi:hypothetical protein